MEMRSSHALSSSVLDQCCLLAVVLCTTLALHASMASAALIIGLKHHHHQSRNNRTPILEANRSTCSLFVGSWVYDNAYPLYQSSCPFIEPEFNCQLGGRPDSDYLKYRWNPLDCELPRFNGEEFLEKMSGKKVMFVGDSLGLNQWESLICMINAAVPKASTQYSRGDPLSFVKFMEYGVTISFYRAPYLVDIDRVQGRRVLRLDEISGNGNGWLDADVLLFNTGHWWAHNGMLRGWDLMESGGHYYQDMDRTIALQKGLKTWATWIDYNINNSRTKLFFQSTSPTHYNPRQWRAGPATAASTKNCYGQTEPLSGSTYPGSYPSQMTVVNAVIKEMRSPVYLLDITMLSELRKDGHPSIYTGDLNAAQKANPDRSSDCSHWCLPGVPDTWNQLVYAILFI